MRTGRRWARYWVLAALAGATPGLAAAADATASLIDRDGKHIGTVTVEQTASGLLHLTARAEGLPPGVRGFHVHETGSCDPESDFKSAGGHLAADRQHGLVEGGPHPGDMPNVHVAADGTLAVEYFLDNITLEGGEAALLGGSGTAVVVHLDPDDYESQPSGDAGERIACGVFERAGAG